MTQQDALEQIIASLNEAMLDDAHWPATSALIDEACGAEGNMLVFGDEPHRDDIEIFLARLCYRGVRDRKGEREYFRIYHRVDERLPRLRRLPDSQVVPIADLFTEEELKTSATYNEVMARGHYQKGLNVRLDGPADSRIVFAMADPVEQGDWSSDQIEMVRRILPHLRQYVRVRFRTRRRGSPPDDDHGSPRQPPGGSHPPESTRADRGGERSCTGSSP